MTFWMPVLFVCLNSGPCTVVYDDPYFTERDCEKAVAALVNSLEAQGVAPTAAACLRADMKTV